MKGIGRAGWPSHNTMFSETCFVKMAFFLLCGEEKVR